MIVLGTLGAIGVVAVGLAIADFFGRRRPRRDVDGSAIDSAKSRKGFPWTGEYLPRPDDGRPQK